VSNILIPKSDLEKLFPKVVGLHERVILNDIIDCVGEPTENYTFLQNVVIYGENGSRNGYAIILDQEYKEASATLIQIERFNIIGSVVDYDLVETISCEDIQEIEDLANELMELLDKQ
jgi:hypothetical protein